jgi:hypothetical protein
MDKFLKFLIGFICVVMTITWLRIMIPESTEFNHLELNE